MNLISESVRTLQQDLRQRASARRRSAAGVLALIVIILGLGILLFLFAGILASREAASAVAKAKKSAIDALRRCEKELADDRATTEAHVKLEQSKLTTAISRPDQVETKHEIETLQKHIHALEAEQTNTAAALQSIEPDIDEPSASTRDAQLPWLVSTMSTRIGTVILLLFLVQVLLPLYRYNTRLASHYDGRADALQLCDATSGGETCDTLVALITAFSSDRVEFGALPVPLTERALQVAKDVMLRHG